MRQALGGFLILGTLAVTVSSAPAPPLDTEQQDGELRLACPDGWEELNLDSGGANKVCILLDMTSPVSSVEVAKNRCALHDAWLAEPEGWLHHEIYERIYDLGYNQAAFWIGGSDQESEGTWIWERTRNPMPMGTPQWEHCEPRQPLVNDRNANYACIWPGDYYFFSCRNDSTIRTMCQKYPTLVKAAPLQ